MSLIPNQQSLKIPLEILKDHRFSLYEKVILSAIEQFTEYRTQWTLAEFLGCSRAKVASTHAKACQLGVFKTPRFFRAGGRDWLKRHDEPITRKDQTIRTQSVIQLIGELCGTYRPCDLLPYSQNDRVIPKRGYWHKFEGRHAYILKDLHRHFRSRIKVLRESKNEEAERDLIALWTEIKKRHERKGVKI